ncbi:hypothetical protein RN001_012976 [Aquatica leii]|uniref:BAH domain-containing protein n=1 Tax=Aquatica leii TaxID=1421715 RepID=A0AAN7S6S0_9COLE|nr:hypothetical protein RN001_012976 [Aquatica leii]
MCHYHFAEISGSRHWTIQFIAVLDDGLNQMALSAIKNRPPEPAPAPAPPISSFTADGFGRYGVYSLFPGGPSLGGAIYSHASTIGRFSSGIPPTGGAPFHATHKESLFSSSGYTFGAPTPPPGSPYSPVTAAQLELFTKGFNSNIIIHQPDVPLSPKKFQEKKCEDKCYQVKSEKQCSCAQDSSARKFAEISSGCSRTNPIDWSLVNVKKEPGSNPCQVAEITTSVSPVVKIEVTSPTHKNSDLSVPTMPSVVTTSGNIPVGIAVARQRIQHHHDIVSSPSLPPTGLLTTVNTSTRMSRLSELDSTPGMAAGTTGGVPGGGAVLQCTEDRSAGLAAWSVSGSHNSTIATPTLWQYPAAVPVEPMVPLPVPPVGVQLVRDPTSGHLLLLPATGIEQVQQTVLWPSYHQPSSVLLPPLPPPPLQLLSSASSDYLSTSTTLHQHTQTHSTRLLAVTTTDTKRKIPLPIPTTTLIKIETDATTLDQTKTLQAVSTIASNTGTVFTDQSMAPLVTTHVIYQHPTNLILSQTPNETSCRSQATSPVTCLTPPPEAISIEEDAPGVQDASNQTDIPISSEDDSTLQVPEIAAEIKKEDEEEVEEQPEVPDATKVDDVPKEDELQTPDLSGLELLSNSIVEFESRKNEAESVRCEQNDGILSRISQMSIGDRENETVITNLDDKLGGLDLLCALAEQRIMEEVEVKNHAANVSVKEKTKDPVREERKKEKRKARRSEESRMKKLKKDYESGKEYKISDKISENCSCKDSDHRTYKSRESKEEVLKFIASKSQTTFVKEDWPEMNAMELDMRMKLAELQRQYKEKQRELSKLKPKRKSLDEKDSRKRKSRKKSTNSEKSVTPPPLLDKIDVLPVKPNKNVDLLKPPTLCAVNNQDPILDYRNLSSTDVSDSSPEKTSSSQKRKVGRPKKLMNSCDVRTSTETIVAKKPKSGSFVGYLLAAKQKLQMQSKSALVYSNSPPRYVEETSKKSKMHKPPKHSPPLLPKLYPEKQSKIRPKLKAELTVKTYVEEEDANNDWEQDKTEELVASFDDSVDKDEDEVVEEEEEEIKVEVEVTPVEELPKPLDNRCILTDEDLEKDKMRVLTAMGGLFYAGQLHSVEPPDVYSITLDGERGNRPHIMSREEILRDAIVEVSPANTNELPVGTRLCAYWSQQYRCLYPGSVAEPGTPDPALDSKFVAVEFDDGDSGRIAIEDIRLLPPNYPIIEYDPNPLLSLSKRKRRISATSASIEERRLSHCLSSVSSPPPTISEPKKERDVEKENKDANNKPEVAVTEDVRERKRLKKKKRDKLKQKLAHDDKKKKKKHKCCDEHCKHKKHHKKHRKRKKHHHKEEEEKKKESSTEKSEEIDEEEPDDEFTEDSDLFPEYQQPVVNPEDEVTMDDIIEAKAKKSKKIRDRQESCESRSKMTAFLPARQLWSWSGKGYRRPKAKGRSRKQFFKSIQRGKEAILVGDSAVFLSTGRPDRPYIGRIEAMWESCGNMVVKVKWFYHPEETVGCPLNLKYPGALFESPHIDENDVQTISHKCEVLPLKEYREKLEDDPKRYATIYDNNDIYYLAGYYDPGATALKIQPDIPFNSD